MKHKEMLAKFIKESRIEAGLTQEELATALGYSTPQFISNWERGVSQPPVNTLILLARLLEVNKDELCSLLLAMKIEELTEDFKKKVKMK
ncbi:helix-turn-helix domain-containing protein [Bdellovibrio sp. HCB337]|uniref:helix-turn-helix domain-containing protein n=1 Tax=Bdellovibrio sp. HCB337 TaxID=3394358 RepID=UPI0039A50740